MSCANVAMMFAVAMIVGSLAVNASLAIDIASLFAAAKSRLIAAEVPGDNDTSAHSLPSNQQWYPNAFEASIVALAWAQLGDASRAVRELNALVDAQWSNGLLPSTVFDARRDSEFPTASFWNANASEFASRSRLTSGVPHPPMIAQTLRFALNRVNVSDELSQFASTRGYDSARRFHDFLAREHDASSLAAGCLWIMHPWSTANAATPLFDAALDAFQIGNFQHMLPKYNRTTTPSTDGIAAATYDRLVVLLVCGAFHEWDALLMAQYCPFRIVDPLFMSLAARDAQALAHVATMLGKSDDAKRYGDLAGRYVKCLEEKLWDEQLGAFVALDLKFYSSARVLTSVGLLPLIAPLTNDNIIRRTLATLRSARMCGAAVGPQACFPAPTVVFDQTGTFSRALPWRGPVSVVVLWLLMQGAHEHNATADGVRLRNAIVELAAANPDNWAQFFDPVSGQAVGLANYSATAAVLIDTIMSDDSLRASLSPLTPSPFDGSSVGGGWWLFAIGLAVLLTILVLALLVRWRQNKLRARLRGVVEDIDHSTIAGSVASGNVELEEESDDDEAR